MGLSGGLAVALSGTPATILRGEGAAACACPSTHAASAAASDPIVLLFLLLLLLLLCLQLRTLANPWISEQMSGGLSFP